MGGTVVIPYLFGMDYSQLPGLAFFQSSKDDTPPKPLVVRDSKKTNTDPPASSGLTKPQWAGIAGAAALIVGYPGYSKLCSSKPTEAAPEKKSGLFSCSGCSDQSGT